MPSSDCRGSPATDHLTALLEARAGVDIN